VRLEGRHCAWAGRRRAACLPLIVGMLLPPALRARPQPWLNLLAESAARGAAAQRATRPASDADLIGGFIHGLT